MENATLTFSTGDVVLLEVFYGAQLDIQCYAATFHATWERLLEMHTMYTESVSGAALP